jgi:hypothetical protein
MARAKTVVSAGVVLYLNGKPYGRVREFFFDSATPRKPLYGIDSTEPFELIPTTTLVTGRIGLVRTVGDGGAEGAAMTTQVDAIPREKYFTLQLIERTSDTVIFEARYCSVTRQSWGAPEKGIVTGTVEWEALDWSNELRTQ